MNHISVLVRSALVALPAALLMLSGCYSQPPEGGTESVGNATEEFDSTCTQAGADATWTSTGNKTFDTPYGTYCYHSVVVDIDNLEVNNPNSANAGILMQWGDTVPTNQTDCNNLWVGAYLFNWNGSAWVWNGLAPANGYGNWVTAFGSGYCSAPEVLFSTSTVGGYSVSNGGTYRVEVTARTSNSSMAAIKDVNVSTQNGIN